MSTPEKSSEAAIAEAIAWLERKWGEHPCPYCGARSWAVGEPVRILAAFPISFGKGGLTPAFTVMCGNCGHTNLINAIVAGIVPEEEQ
jgi:hypothetical protein